MMFTYNKNKFYTRKKRQPKSMLIKFRDKIQLIETYTISLSQLDFIPNFNLIKSETISETPDHAILAECMDTHINYYLGIQYILALKPGSHQRHKHKHKIDTKTKHDFSSGTCEDKTTRIFLCFVFCSALGLCFDYVLMLVLMSLYMSQA